MVNPALESRTYPPTDPHEVTEAEISAFAAAVWADNALHHDSAAAQAAGYDGVVAPPSFAVTLSQRAEAVLMADPEAQVDYARLVHGEQSFTHHRPIVAGMIIHGVLHVDKVRQAGGHSMLTTSTELRDADESVICTAKSTVVIRGEG